MNGKKELDFEEKHNMRCLHHLSINWMRLHSNLPVTSFRFTRARTCDILLLVHYKRDMNERHTNQHTHTHTA